MSAWARLIRIFWKWGAPVAGLGALAFALFLFFHSPAERSHRLRMAAANPLGVRYRLAKTLKADVAGEGLELELQDSEGSEADLDAVNNHTLDVALVQGGLSCADRPNVRQVLSLEMEALHLLVKKELYDAVSHHLGALEGKTVHLGEANSGNHSLAVEVLAFAGLHPQSSTHPHGYISVEVGRQELFAEQDRARLPDAVLLVSLLPSSTAHYLVTRQDYRLVALPFAEAFGLEALAREESAPEGPATRSRVEKEHTYPTRIPAFVCSVEPPVPPEPVPTLGTRLLLVAHRDVDPHVVRRLLEATLQSKAARNGRPPIDAQVLELPPEFPWHDGTRLYLARNRPVVSGTVVDLAHKGFAIFAAAASGLFVLYQWSRQRTHWALDGGFSPYLRQVTSIEKQALSLERGQSADPGQLQALREELGRLKTEALDRFTEGDIGGKEMLAGFLAEVADVRACLTRLTSEPRDPPGSRVATGDGAACRPVSP
jgi:TRAP-type uncharacterized transport system substrate-binding protein